MNISSQRLLLGGPLALSPRCEARYGVLAVAICAVFCAGTFAENPIVIHDLTQATGITFRHTDGGSGQRYLVEVYTAGLACFDYNQDGLIDIYFINGAPLKGADTKARPRNALYRNDGDFHFTDVTDQSGLGDTGFGLGVAVADYDNDGDPDVYVNNYGPNVLYSNNGDGTFTDVTKRAKVGNGSKVGAGTCFLDIEGDGCLDLYAANYVRFTYETHVYASIRDVPIYSGPLVFPSEPDDLYRNVGDGTFVDVSVASGIAAHAGTGMGMICADYDDDGDTDIFVCSDQQPNFLFQNDGAGRFEEVGLFAGFAVNVDGRVNGSMGVDCGDYDNDGKLDFFETNYQDQTAILYRNVGDGLLEDITQRTGAGAGSLAHVTWGAGFVNIDNDGDRDLYVACGHVQDLVEMFDDLTSYHAHNILLENRGQGRFVDESSQCGDGLAVKLSSRGMALDDLDNDGDIDIVVLNSDESPRCCATTRGTRTTGCRWRFAEPDRTARPWLACE